MHRITQLLGQVGHAGILSTGHLILAVLFYKAVLGEGLHNVDVVLHFQEHAIISSLQQVLQQCQRLGVRNEGDTKTVKLYWQQLSKPSHLKVTCKLKVTDG